MRVLVACEFGGAVRDAFRARGFEAWSCDLEDVEPEGRYPNYHLFGDVHWFLDGPMGKWDMMIAHPPCTHITASGARHFAEKKADGRQDEALAFVRELLGAPIKHIALENPVSIISSRIRKPDQIIQPWQFGHGETKATCLWLKNLPKLRSTNIVEGREARVHRMAPSAERAREREVALTKASPMRWPNSGAIIFSGRMCSNA